MRVLIASTAGAGHFGPLVPFASACLRTGHEVLVAAPQSFAGTVEAAGFPFWLCADTSEEEWGAVMARLPSLSHDEANAVVIGEVFAGLDATAVLPGVLAAIDEWRPDVIVRESAEFGSAVAAELRSVPHVRVAPSLGSTDQTQTSIAAPALGPLRAAQGLAEDVEGERILEEPYFSLLPLSFEDPACPGPAHAFRFRDARPEAPSPLPAWWADDSRPLLYVTFGSVAASVPTFSSIYRTALDAVADLPARILLTVGRDLDVGPVPDNVRVEAWVPQADVLASAAAMVCHCGFGTMLGGLVSGVPMVAVPLFADQPDNARRVDAAGVGIAVEDRGADPEALREAVAKVLEDESYRRRMQAVAADIGGLPPTEAAVDELRSIAGA